MRRSGAALFALAAAAPAYAHSTFGEIGGFWSGTAHVVISPVAMAVLIALACRIATHAPKSAFISIAVVIPSSGITSAFINDAVVGPVAAALIGGLAALAPRQYQYECVPLGLLAGVAAGSSVALDSVGWLACLGVSAAAGWIALFAFEGLVRLEPMSSVPRRVIASWVAALGVLLVALAVRGTGNQPRNQTARAHQPAYQNPLKNGVTLPKPPELRSARARSSELILEARTCSSSYSS